MRPQDLRGKWKVAYRLFIGQGRQFSYIISFREGDTSIPGPSFGSNLPRPRSTKCSEFSSLFAFSGNMRSGMESVPDKKFLSRYVSAVHSEPGVFPNCIMNR